MAGNTFGKNFTVTTWGEPGEETYGCVIDGCPAGLSIDQNDIARFLLRRFPDADMIPVNPYGIPMDFGTDAFGNGVPIDPFGTLMETRSIDTSYSEEPAAANKDEVTLLSGVFESKTTGAPLAILIKCRDNADGNNMPADDDPEEYKEIYRPGHADYTYEAKYGQRDWRGGRASGKETVARLAAGAVAEKLLSELGIRLETESGVLAMAPENDSVGGMVQCVVTGMPAGIGEPVFDKLDARLAQAVMSIGAVKSFEIGAGGMVSQMTGSFNNDPYVVIDGRLEKQTNNAGGISGGISDGDEIIIKAAVKPAPSIGLPQEAVDKDLHEVELTLAGRHAEDIVEQTAVVVESMIAVTLVDLLFENMHAKLTSLTDFYRQ